MLAAFNWPLAVIALWSVGAILVGVLANRLLTRVADRLAHWRFWGAGALAIANAAHVVVIWCALAGLELGAAQAHLSGRAATFVDRAVTAIFLLTVTWLAGRVAASGVRSYARRLNGRILSVSLVSSVAQVTVGVIGLLMILSSLDIRIEPLLTALGVGGLAVALALQDTLANLFAGIQITASRQLRPGDLIRLESGAEGRVLDVNWRNTTIAEYGEDIIVVPNAKLASAVFTNFSAPSGLWVCATAVVPWKGSAAELLRVAQRAAGEVSAGNETEHAPDVYVSALNETTIEITAYVYVGNYAQRMHVRSTFLERLHDYALDPVTR